MKRSTQLLATLGLLMASAGAFAAGADLGQADKQATNWTAIAMFGTFVLATLWITKWAASKTRSAADFYTAGGGITGFQNGLAIAGDYMSAASFLGISAAVMASGYDGLIYLQELPPGAGLKIRRDGGYCDASLPELQERTGFIELDGVVCR